jgi:2-oxoacid:acceptor oxidoreductase delta subunit (pyruvate/2-ketoisovalerate family)
MHELKRWEELPVAGAVVPGTTARPRTGSWRTGLVPRADLSRCVDCLLCWIHCPDSAILLDGTTFTGVDTTICKGCELCAEVCPVGAIDMVAEP